MNNDIVIVDDDEIFCKVLANAISKKGWKVHIAHNYEQALRLFSEHFIHYAIIDLKITDCSGLTLIPALKQLNTNIKIIMLTGYASIATAIEAIKLGAVHYLVKPTDADEILAAFGKIEGDSNINLNSNLMSVDRLEWEHINKVLAEFQGNISRTARQLGMHRRTLQRKLAKKPVNN